MNFNERSIVVERESNLLVVGLSKCGKSHLVSHIIRNCIEQELYDSYVVFNSQDKNRGEYSIFRHKTITFDKVNHYIELQTRINDGVDNYNMGKDVTTRKNYSHMLIVLDDAMQCTRDFYGANKAKWTNLLGTCRHSKVSVIFVIQTLNNTIPPGFKDQLKNIILFHPPKSKQILSDLLPPIRNSEERIMDNNEIYDLCERETREEYRFIIFTRESSKAVRFRSCKIPIGKKYKIGYRIIKY